MSKAAEKRRAALNHLLDGAMRGAMFVATDSQCERLKVGCKILALDDKGVVVTYVTKFNGPRCPCASTLPGACGHQHAERLAADEMLRDAAGARGFSLSKTTIIAAVTHSPCEDCARRLIALGVREVWYREAYRLRAGVDLLLRSGVRVCRWSAGDVTEEKL